MAKSGSSKKKANAKKTTDASESTGSLSKVRRRRPEQVKSQILKSALNSFGTHGFEGTSTRMVARDADVSISLLIHHFKNKENLWKEVVKNIILRSSAYPLAQRAADQKLSTTDMLRALIRETVLISAEYPALHRLMTYEAHQLSERLIWLCDTYLRENFDAFHDLISKGQKEGVVHQTPPARLRYAILAIAAIPFSIAAEYQYLAKRDPFSNAEIERTIELIERIIFIEPQGPPVSG